MPVPIQLCGVASGPLGLASLGLSGSLLYEGGHKAVTVIFWAVLGLGLVAAAAIYWLARWRQKGSNGTDTNVNYGRQDVGINKGTFNKGD
jgi:membrane-associated phospholipid phosphatase